MHGARKYFYVVQYGILMSKKKKVKKIIKNSVQSVNLPTMYNILLYYYYDYCY